MILRPFSSLNLIHIRSMSPQSTLPTVPTASASFISPRLRGFLIASSIFDSRSAFMGFNGSVVFVLLMLLPVPGDSAAILDRRKHSTHRYRPEAPSRFQTHDPENKRPHPNPLS